jgi:hypothetical protein
VCVHLRYVPEPVPQDHGAGCQGPKGGVVLLGQHLQVVRVLPLPLGPPVLEPDLDLDNKWFLEPELGFGHKVLI